MGATKRKQISPRRFAETMLRGGTIEESNLRAGYSQASAKRGWACPSRVCKEEYAKQLNVTLAQLEESGGKLTPEQRTKVIRGKLLRNVAEGKDESTASLKLLGADKELGMWQPENMTGIIILEAPKNLPEPPPLPPVLDVPAVPALPQQSEGTFREGIREFAYGKRS